jgi:hypothetical protein
MADWTTEDVAARFAEAAETGRRLPRVQVQGYFNVWPAFAREAWETYPEDEPDYRPLPPSLQAIERMLETMRWVQWLEVEQRHVVWMRARRYGWRDIALRAACCPGRRNATGNVQSRALPTGSTKRGPWHHEKILIGLSDTFGLLRKPARHCQIQRLREGVASRTVFRYSHGYGWERCGSSERPENHHPPPDDLPPSEGAGNRGPASHPCHFLPNALVWRHEHDEYFLA